MAAGRLVQDSSSLPSAEQPILRIGAVGFNPDQLTLLETVLQRPASLPRWRVGAFAEADAWMVNGARVTMTADGILRVSPGLPAGQSVNLNPDEVDRPVAFATPLASPDVEPRCTFRLDSVPTIHGTLLQFENWMRHLRSLFALGCDVVRMGAELRRGIFHLSSGGVLLAVLDFSVGKAGISPHAHPADFARAKWDKRPPGAGDIPATFIRTSPAELAWAYASRSEKDLLPERYVEQVVYFRRAPNVPPRWVRDSQLLLLRELATQGCSFSALRQRTGLARDELHRDLTCLYFAGAITATRSKAARTALHRESGPDSAGAGMESHGEVMARPRFATDMTAPASLEYRRSAETARAVLKA